MKKLYLLLSMAILAILCSCAGKKATEEFTEVKTNTQVFTFKDSCRNVVVSLSLELPQGVDSVSVMMRDSLIADFIRTAQQPGYNMENDNNIELYTGDMNDTQAIVDHYGRADFDLLLKNALADYEERVDYIRNDSSMTEEERNMRLEDVTQWAFEMNIRKMYDSPAFAVYQSQAYAYYGGAHGGVFGTGAITFDKANNNMISRLILPDATKALQPLIRKGLLQYYNECGDTITDAQLSERLLIEGEIIPQPRATPFPNATGDSLTFTYGQYEIASYADGMPSFTLPVKSLLPYLTAEGKDLLGK